jgi:hypothetical protein
VKAALELLMKLEDGPTLLITKKSMFLNSLKKEKMLRSLLFLISLVLLSQKTFSNDTWQGMWIATDEWQSEYNVIIKKDGVAISEYGNGEEGIWKIKDGNLEITWESGSTDYWFNGVMGFQRLFKDKNKSYTSGIRRKLLDNP